MSLWQEHIFSISKESYQFERTLVLEGPGLRKKDRPNLFLLFTIREKKFLAWDEHKFTSYQERLNPFEMMKTRQEFVNHID